jgi:hypothetical protein
MARTTTKLVLYLVAAHVLLGTTLVVIEAIHGINDQDASFAVALLFYYLNWPAYWLLGLKGGAPGILMVLLVGIVQWTGVAFVIAVVRHSLRSGWRAIAGQATRNVEPPDPAAGK